MMTTDTVLSVDLGGTHMRAALIDRAGNVLARHSQLTPQDTSAPDALVALIDLVAGGNPPSTAVIGLPGRVDYEAGRLEYAPNLPPSWCPHLAARHLSKELGVTVSLANDADLAAVGETFFGAGRGHTDVVYVTVSTGVGAGVVLGRRLVRGRLSLAEIGHTVIERSCLPDEALAMVEGLASGTGLARQAAARGIATSTSDLVELVRRNDPAALDVWADGTGAAGVAVVNLVHLFSPDLVVVGGGVAQTGDLLLDPIRELVARHGPRNLSRPIEVRTAALGDDAGLAGAAAWLEAVG